LFIYLSEISAFVGEVEFFDSDVAVADVVAFALEFEAAGAVGSGMSPPPLKSIHLH
jgi:hypothetical protein